MRILITGSSYAPAFNGQSIFTTTLAEGLARRGHEVWVLTPSDTGKPYYIERNGVHIQTVRAIELGFLHNQLYVAFFPDLEVHHFFKTHKPEIVHVQDHYPLSFSVLHAARRLKIKVIGTNHFMPDNLAPYIPLLSRIKPFFNSILWMWMKWTFNSLDVVTAPSATAAEIIRSQGVHVPVYPISCGVSLARFHPDAAVDKKALRLRYGLDPERKTFLFVGRVDREKRVDLLIRAIKILARKDIQLAIIGTGAALPMLKALGHRLQLEDQVRFTDFVPASDLPGLLNSVEFFAMPSETELLSIASLEAMASGLPLLAARARALPELVTDGLNGYLFKPGDAVDAARCMALLADHPENWAKMGATSLGKVVSHDIENVLKRYEELYTQLL
jgi:glycosyltransferase involved in cell wall biosynthesis